MEFRRNATLFRTNRVRKLCWTLVVLLISELNAKHIDFDDAEVSWLRDVAVEEVLTLKLTGLPSIEIEDGVRIKATFAPNDCHNNETDLRIFNAAPSKGTHARTSDLFISLSDIDFKGYSTAYLCIRTALDHMFLHMGPKSQFAK